MKNRKCAVCVCFLLSVLLLLRGDLFPVASGAAVNGEKVQVSTDVPEHPPWTGDVFLAAVQVLGGTVIASAGTLILLNHKRCP